MDKEKLAMDLYIKIYTTAFENDRTLEDCNRLADRSVEYFEERKFGK